jgi:Tol biopolymer transport system component
LKLNKLIAGIAGLAIAAAALAVYTNCSVISDTSERSFFPAISSNGNRVAYWVGDPSTTNSNCKIVLYDKLANTRTTVSGTLDRVGRPSISRDGNCVGFLAKDPNDGNVYPYVYRVSNTTLTRCPHRNLISNVVYGGYNMWPPAISDTITGDSSTPAVAMVYSHIDPLAGADVDVEVWNLNSGSLTRVSGGAMGAQPVISADGLKVGFVSSANLLSNSSGVQQVFLSEGAGSPVTWSVSEVVSVSSAGSPGNAASSQPSMSANGSKIAFVSTASNLTSPAGTSGFASLYLRDRSGGGSTTLAYDNDQSLLGAFGVDGLMPSISPDGGWIAFMVGKPPTGSTFAIENSKSSILGPTVALLNLESLDTEAVCYYYLDTTNFHCRYSTLASVANNADSIAFDSSGANVCSGYSSSFDRVYLKWGR